MENNNKTVKTDKTQIEKIFEEAPGGQAGGYPEECCDAAEISDEEYARWARGSERGFWRTFLENQ